MGFVASDGRLTVLAAALEQTGLAATLSGEGPYTLLSPSNGAFDRLSGASRDALLGDSDTLRHLLSRHILLGELSEIELATIDSVDTLAGVPLQVELIVVESPSVCCGFDQALLIDGVEILWSYVETSNGAIFLIDQIIASPA
jgi:uncharacterized surface protein with fasciclin (FAS1) repeats